MEITWLTAFLDSPVESASAAEAFWCAVTGSTLSARRGEGGQFATLVPADGDAYLRVQVVGEPVLGMLHLDLHTDDLSAAADRVRELGGAAEPREVGLVVCTSQGGLTFCLVLHPGVTRPGAVAWPGGCSLVDQVCLDIPAVRFDSEAGFWAGLTGWERRRGSLPEFDYLERPDGVPLRVLLQRLGDDDSGVVRAHLDLASEDREAEVARHTALGAVVVRRTDRWTTLRDPAGRDYCVTHRDPGTGRLG